MKNVYRDSVKIKKGICGVLIAVGMAIMTGCGERAIAPEVSDMEETAQNMSAVETGSQPERETVSVMGSVPYFKDDAGTNTQTVDGWIYGYWYNRLCRYDPETLEETVLYEAASPQNGDFCIWGGLCLFYGCA